jgi:hypothetical protein
MRKNNKEGKEGEEKGGGYKKKEGHLSQTANLFNLKSNTMKNTLQR